VKCAYGASIPAGQLELWDERVRFFAEVDTLISDFNMAYKGLDVQISVFGLSPSVWLTTISMYNYVIRCTCHLIHSRLIIAIESN
jgi:hypothetical protein